VVAAIALTHVPIYTRLIRGEMLKARETEYAEAARTVGNRPHQIVLYHLFPNCVPPLIVQATLAMGFAILTVAALSFIGLGIQPPQSEWGQMTAEGAGYVVSGEWWLVLFPGFAIMLTVSRSISWATPCATFSTRACEECGERAPRGARPHRAFRHRGRPRGGRRQRGFSVRPARSWASFGDRAPASR